MHASSFENMRKCFEKYGSRLPMLCQSPVTIVEIGSADINGSYRKIFPAPAFQYIGADLQAGEGVDVVIKDPYHAPLPDNFADIVISGQMLEHCEFFWLAFLDMMRILKPNGLLFLIAPSAGPIHNYPVDCYRFYPDAYRALAKHGNCQLLDVWHDDRGPWQDLVGVFYKGAMVDAEKLCQKNYDAASMMGTEPYLLRGQAAQNSEEETVRGTIFYRDILDLLHLTLKPSRYVEIGVRHGASLSLAQCPAIGIDPIPEINIALPKHVQIFRETSDWFFAEHAAQAIGDSVDLAFIDGMHRFEYALRDFMNIELFSHEGTVVVFDDIFPNHPKQARRDRQTQVWTGDVWKIVPCLRKYRPDLTLIPINTKPTGLLIILGLDRNNRVLREQYNPVVREFLEMAATPPADILNRENAYDDLSGELFSLLHTISEARLKSDRQTIIRQSLATWRQPRSFCSSHSRTVAIKNLRLSVIVVCYNMHRELPRTIRSLSSVMQKDIEPEDYEIIIVDNGSSSAYAQEEFNFPRTNIRWLRTDIGSVSPAHAVNQGLQIAKGELIGVLIDGARIASPGLLAGALQAQKMHPRPVIATPNFHLGQEVQMSAVKNGYNQLTEDLLLKESNWTADGYRLFNISVFAGSSSNGWFAPIAESNAFFLTQDLWKELGGYDEKFVLPGGGLVNLDTYRRACTIPDSRLFILLGEGTFHQVHGGIATNALVSPCEAFHHEYVRIRGQAFAAPTIEPVFVGRVRPEVLKSIAFSASNNHANQSSVMSDRELKTPDVEGNINVAGRSFVTAVDASLLSSIQNGVLKTHYRGRQFLKSPFDVMLYLQLIQKIRPKTILEIGTKEGGSVLWFADMLLAHGIDGRVIGIDINPIPPIHDSRIKLLQGDACHLDQVLSKAFLDTLPHPFLVVEDSAHIFETTDAVLRFFDGYLLSGDYIAIEDGILQFFAEEIYKKYNNGPNRAVVAFLEEHAGQYAVDEYLCDFFGKNVTYNPNGYLRKI